MRRSRPPLSDPAKVRAWQERSRRAQALEVDERAVRDAVFARDGHRCQLRPLIDLEELRPLIPPCLGPLTYHHRRKAAASGAYTLDNGVALCAGHNRWVEDEPDQAAEVWPYLVVREGDPEWAELGRRAQRER